MRRQPFSVSAELIPHSIPKSIAFVLVLLFTALPALPLHAEVIETLYEVEMPVVDQDAKTRREAFDAGLKEVLIRITGDRNIFSLIKLPYSASYVKQYRYSGLDDLSVQGDEEAIDVEELTLNQSSKSATQALWIQYNETKINDYIRSNALPRWSKHRFDTVMWLAVNDGSNRYVLKDADVSVLKSMFNQSSVRRGLPLIWPPIKADETAIRFADVWSALTVPLKTLSRRYSKGPILIGRLSWLDNRWVSEWTLLIDDKQTDWAIEDVEYQKLLDEAVDIAADTMGQQYALFESGEIDSFHAIDIEVRNVNSIAALNNLRTYLSSVPLVQQLSLSRIENGRVYFDLLLRSSSDDFLHFVQSDPTLLQLPDEVYVEKTPLAGLKAVVQKPPLATPERTTDYRFKLQL